MKSGRGQRVGGSSWVHRLARGAGIVGALALTTAMMLVLAPGMGAFALDITQCDAVGNGGGQGLECHIEVVNSLDLTDPLAPVESSTVTVTSCLGAAAAATTGVCTSLGPVGYTEVVTNIDQCNYAVNGGGSTLVCIVDVLNYVTGGPAPVDPTVNECNDSVTTGDVKECDTYLPSLSTDPATATVVQCNDSDNGGGSVLHCSLAEGSTTSPSLTVRVNQCNNSANGGGSSVICRAVIRNAYRPDTTVPYVPPAPITVSPISPVVAQFVPVVPTQAAETLANTGSSPQGAALAGFALGLILLGGGAVVASRRLDGGAVQSH